MHRKADNIYGTNFHTTEGYVTKVKTGVTKPYRVMTVQDDDAVGDKYLGLFDDEELELLEEAQSMPFPIGTRSKDIGAKVGDEFIVHGNNSTFAKGTRITLAKDDGSCNPFFVRSTVYVPDRGYYKYQAGNRACCTWSKLAPIQPQPDTNSAEPMPAFKVGELAKATQHDYNVLITGYSSSPEEPYIGIAQHPNITKRELPWSDAELEPIDGITYLGRDGYRAVTDQPNEINVLRAQTKKENILMSLVNKARTLVQSAERKRRLKYGIENQAGERTVEGTELMLELLWADKDMQTKLDEKLAEIEKDEEKEAKKSK